MKKVFLGAILASLSYPAIASSLHSLLSQKRNSKVKMKSKGSMTNGSRSATGKSSKRSNVAQMPRPPLTKERQRQIRKLVRINWTPKPLRTKNAIKVMKMSYAA